MGWASHAVKKLKEGQSVVMKPRGHSMTPRVHDGDSVVVSPCKQEELEKDDVVLVSVKGRVYLHLIKAVDGNRFQIGNNKGHINGWVNFKRIHGKMR